MSIIDVIILLFLIVIILKELRWIKELIIPITKSITEIIAILFGIAVFICITYFFAKNWLHYGIGILAIFMFICMWIKQGINSRGFASMYRYKEIISWNEIKKITIISSENIKIKLSGEFMDQTFYFKKDDYNKITSILNEKLPTTAQVEKILD